MKHAPLELLPLDSAEWADFVQACPEAGPFHHPAWAQTIASIYGFTGRAMVLRDAEGEIVAGLPAVRVPSLTRTLTWKSLPFTDRCGPLGSSDARVPLMRCLAARPHERWEVRESVPALASAQVGLSHHIDLSGGRDEVFGRCHKSQIQRAILKAQREGLVSVREASEPRDLADVYYRLHAATRKRQGVPPQPRRLFEALWQRLHTRGLAWTLIAEVDQKPIAGAVFLAWNRKVVYKYGASLTGAWRLRPNHLIFWQAIQRAISDGALTFDFGRTDMSNHGLVNFKRNWGTTEEALVYSRTGKPPSPGSPSRMASLIGPAIKHAPLAVNEVIGTLLYRFAA